MTICSHTGLAKPECSCQPCLRAQVEQHMPTLLQRGAVPAAVLGAQVTAADQQRRAA